jgi:hypothetical protein
MGNARLAQQWVRHFLPRPQTRPVQNAQQATELVERQAIELIELIRLEEKKL